MELYEPLEVIGSGAFGQVTKIRRKSDSRTLVWKELNYGSMSEREKQQIVAEVNILRELRSPFIVRYYDRIVDRQSCKLYIVMEYCAGGDLGHVIKKCKRNRTNLEESIIWRVTAQLVLALKDCHHREDNGEIKPILHRDIKPANILLDQNKNIKLGDFGLAKELSSAGKLAQTHVGTPFYMSPEIISGRSYGEKSDIWAIGCLLYELAALRPPFDAGNQLELADKIRLGKYHRIPSKYSNQLSDIIGACLQVDPTRRPRLEEMEAMAHVTPLQIAISEAKKITKEYEMYQSYSDKFREVKMREDAVKAREDSVRIREENVQQRESEVASREGALARREREAATPQYYDMMELEQPTEARMSMCTAEPPRRPTQPAFAIHCDSGAATANVREASKPHSNIVAPAGENSAKENLTFGLGLEGAIQRSAKIDNLLARATILTQQRREPPPVPTTAETIAKKLLADTPVLFVHSSPPGNSDAIYIARNGDEGSASKRRRRSEARAPPPPPTRSKTRDESTVASVHVDLRALLPSRIGQGAAALRLKNMNTLQPAGAQRIDLKYAAGEKHYTATTVNDANTL